MFVGHLHRCLSRIHPAVANEFLTAAAMIAVSLCLHFLMRPSVHPLVAVAAVAVMSSLHAESCGRVRAVVPTPPSEHLRYQDLSEAHYYW